MVLIVETSDLYKQQIVYKGQQYNRRTYKRRTIVQTRDW